MSKIKVKIGFKDLRALKPQQRVYDAEFASVYEMHAFIAREGLRGDLRILALVKNIDEDFDDGYPNAS